MSYVTEPKPNTRGGLQSMWEKGGSCSVLYSIFLCYLGAPVPRQLNKMTSPMYAHQTHTQPVARDLYKCQP